MDLNELRHLKKKVLNNILDLLYAQTYHSVKMNLAIEMLTMPMYV